MKAKRFLMITAALLTGVAFAQQPDAPGSKRVQRPEEIVMGNLTEAVAPQVPGDLKDRIASKVILQIVVDKEGKVFDAKVLSGEPTLASASLDAVRQWKFRPYFLDGVKVEVETTATIEFIAEPPYVITPKPYQGPLRIRVSSGVLDGLVAHKVKPDYPTEAKAKHTQGEVILAVTINRDGKVADLKPLSGNPLLVEAAVQAVRQWKYKPFLVNGEPVEVQSMIHIQFRM